MLCVGGVERISLYEHFSGVGIQPINLFRRWIHFNLLVQVLFVIHSSEDAETLNTYSPNIYLHIWLKIKYFISQLVYL